MTYDFSDEHETTQKYEETTLMTNENYIVSQNSAGNITLRQAAEGDQHIASLCQSKPKREKLAEKV